MRLLNRYIARHALLGILVVLAILAALFSFLTFVDELDKVGKGTYTGAEALAFVLLTLPNRLMPLIPMAILIGCTLSLSLLASTRELTALQALGISDARMALALGQGALVVVVGALAVMELIAPPLEQHAYQRRAEALSGDGALATTRGLWSRKGQELVHIRGLEAGKPVDLDLFQLDPSGEGLASHLHAERATIEEEGGKWLLEDTVRRRFAGGEVTVDRRQSVPWQSFIDPEMLDQLVLPTRSLAPSELSGYIQDLRSRGQDPDPYVQTFWRKLTMPVAAAAMYLLALVMIYGPLGRASTGERLLLGTGVGLAFYLGDELFASLGLFLTLPTALTATLPRLGALVLGALLFAAVTWPRRGGTPRQAMREGSRPGVG